MRKTRVLLADDHPFLRGGLRVVLDRQSHLIVVAEAADGRQAVDEASRVRPDIAVLDIAMPNLNGVEAAFQIHANLPETGIIMLSMHADEGYVLRALKAGARGYLLKESAEADLITAIRAVSGGKAFFSPSVSRVLVEDYLRQTQGLLAEDSFDLLTIREHEILQLLAEGKSNKDVANLLNLSVYTVESHRANVMEKLNLNSVAELILFAVRKGVIR